MPQRFVIPALCLCAAAPASGETIRWGFSPSDPPPYVVMQGDKLGPSITRSMAELVASRLGLEIEFVEVPNNRIDRSLRGGRIDLVCNTSPAWHSAPQEHSWSQPLYRDADVIVTRSGASVPASLSDMKGMRVGTAHDQHYPAKLLEAFRKGTIVRMDVRDTETRLRMVEHKRLDASVERRLAVKYHLQKHPDNFLAVSPWALREIPLHCAAEQHHRNIGKRALAMLNRLAKEEHVANLLNEFGLIAEQ